MNKQNGVFAWNWPNGLTIFRFLLVAVFPAAYFLVAPVWGLLVYLLASLSDLLDGYIARRTNAITPWGQTMDPVADKLMLSAVLVCLSIDGRVWWWLTAVAVFKEAATIVGGVALYRYRALIKPADAVGKAATILFCAAVVLSFVWLPASQAVFVLALCVSLAAAVHYGLQALSAAKKGAS